MALQIIAVLDHATVVDVLKDLTPLTISLGEGRSMEVHRPSVVEFVATEGLRVQTSAKLTWKVAGIPLTFTIASVHMLLRPGISGVNHDRLNFSPLIEDADLKNVPDMIDRSLVSHVNEYLAAHPDLLGWDFGKTLALRLKMPPSMAPIAYFEMDAREPSVTVTRDALRFALELPLRFTRPDQESSE